MKRLFILIILGTFIIMSAGSAMAHFGMVIPSDSMVMQDDNRTVTVTLSFSHPFEGEGMDLVKPALFGVMDGVRQVNCEREHGRNGDSNPAGFRSCMGAATPVRH